MGHERIQRQCNSPLTITAQQDIVVRPPPAYLFTQYYTKCADNKWNMNRLEWRPPTWVLRQSIVVMFRLLIQPLPEFTLNTFHNWVSQCSSVLACALTLVETWIACFTAGDICRNQISSLLDDFGDPMLRNGALDPAYSLRSFDRTFRARDCEFIPVLYLIDGLLYGARYTTLYTV